MINKRTVKYRRKLVNDFLNKFPDDYTDKLQFRGWFRKKSKYFDSSKASLDSMVLKCIELMWEFPSVDEFDTLETHNGAYRSVLDIWRHIKNFVPDITIFEVMNSVYRVHGQLNCQICNEIKRRVFYNPRITKMNFSGTPFNRHAENKDEFGLYFDEWEDI